MRDRIGVGIIGVQPGRSWAATAHIPALRALADRFEIVGVSNRTAESSRAAAAAVGVSRGYGSVEELIAAPEVDLVAICVKVPHHAAMVKAAIAAGKHVYCEWPLARTLEEAIELAALARASHRLAMVGTQAVVAPAVRQLATLIANGVLGEVLSTTLVGSGMTWGHEIEQRNEYLLDAENGATMLTIPVGHALAAVQQALGEMRSVSALLRTRRQAVRVLETGQNVPLRAPDQVLFMGELEGGIPLALHYSGGAPRGGEGLLWEVNGTGGSARITSGSGLLQMAGLRLSTALEGAGVWQEQLLPVDRPHADGVRRLYEEAWKKLAGRTSLAPDLDDAVKLHHVIRAIETSAETASWVEVTRS